MSRGGVLCAGTVLVDVGKVIDAYPALDHLATIEQVSLSTGGPGLNMAVDLRMLGAAFPIGVLGAVGDDEHAAFILAECARLGIEVAGVRKLAGAVTSFTDGMIERDGGRRTFFHHSGANALFDASAADLGRARILHAGAPGIHPVMDRPRPGGGNGWSALLQRAQAAGLHTNLEMVSLAPDRTAQVARPCLPCLDSIVINELEAGALTGIEASAPTADGPADWPALEAMALGLIEQGVSVLAVVHFPAGCVAAAPGGRTWRQGSVRLPREQVRSTTGAGDAFAAGVILGLHEGWPVERCLRLAVASAAASRAQPAHLRRHQARGTMPRRSRPRRLPPDAPGSAGVLMRSWTILSRGRSSLPHRAGRARLAARGWPCERLSSYRKGCTVDERLLLVEDDASIREIVSIGLKAAGFRVATAVDGREGLARVRADGFDAVILDVMLPSLDGYEVCREIRKFSRVPIVMLTARTDLIDVVVGLESGADDYVKKPFELPELIARLRAVLRRAAAPAEAEPIVAGQLEIDPAGFTVRKDGIELALTATEFRLLLELARRPGQVFTRELLLQRVWDYEYLGESHLVDVAIGRLRAKVEDDPSHPALIKTIRGVGYRLDRA